MEDGRKKEGDYMKISRIGWVGKTVKLKIVKEKGIEHEWTHVFIEPTVFGKRGFKNDWHPSDWPPRKVEVIVRDAK